MTSTTMTIDQLSLSPFNVRTDAEDTAPNDAMQKSILAFGLIHALRVHPMKGNKRRWGVHAGGRRYRAIKALVDRGDLPRDWPVDVVVRDASDADLQAESVAENILRRDLQDYERFAGVARSHRRGDSVEKIAEICGQEPITIRKWIRLGDLAKPVFDALERKAIGVEHAKAYAATDDHALQIAAFEHFHAEQEWNHTPEKIRAFLRMGDVELGRLLRYVGIEAYIDAGGGLELDLFTKPGEEDRARVRDEPLLRKLAHERMADLRELTRATTQRPSLRFVPHPPQAHGAPDAFLRVTPKETAPDQIDLPDGDVVAYIAIAESGEPVVSYWWASMKAKHGVKRDKPAPGSSAPPPGGGPERMAAHVGRPQSIETSKEETGLSPDGVEIFTSLRTFILRGALLENAADMAHRDDVATDYLIWAQLRILLKGDMPHLIGLRGFTAGEPGPRSARDHIAATEASRMYGHALYELQQQTFFTGTDLGEAYRDYRASAPSLKRKAAAVVTGLVLQRSLGGNGDRVPIHDAVAGDLDLRSDARVRKFWRPTAALLDLLTKAERLAIAGPFVESASFAPWSRAKSADVTKFVLQVVTGTANTVRASMADAAARWVHPLLRFTGPDDQEEPEHENEPVNDNADKTLEAAE